MGHPIILRVAFIVLLHIKEMGVLLGLCSSLILMFGLMMCQPATERLTGIMLIT